MAKKPVAPQSGGENLNNVKRDPFDNPSSDLLIAEVPQHNPTHILVLNKFPVIQNHFILATKPNKSQTDLLEKDDLEITYSCLKEWESSASGASKRLFAFFNSGEHSGASQPHRHLQFLPVEDMAQLDDRMNWEPLIDKPLDDNNHTTWNADNPKPHDTPFTCYAVDISREPSPDELHQTYLALYRTAAAAVNGQHTESSPRSPNLTALQTEGHAAISYNLAITTSRMIICPRRSEYAWIQLDKTPSGDILDEGLVKLNGTVLAGTLMVKAESEWSALQNQPTVLDSVLQTVGVPWPVVSASRV